MITRRLARGLVRAVEVWFDDTPETTEGFDLVIHRQRSARLHPDRWRYFNTMLFDLSRTEEQLLDGMNRTTGREIRRARDTDGIQTSFIMEPTREDIQAFKHFYDRQADRAARTQLGSGEMEMLRREGLLSLSRAEAPDGRVLVWRANLCYPKRRRVRGLYGVSAQDPDPAARKLAGRANRYLHFEEMRFFKARGYAVYDFGGWYVGSEDAKRLNINGFKEGFGGDIAVEFDCEEPVSVVGWLYYYSHRLFCRCFRPSWVRERARRRESVPAQASD